MAQQIQRWKFYCHHVPIGDPCGGSHVTEHDGEWVQYKDVAPLLAEALKPSHNNRSDEIAFLSTLLTHFQTTDYKHMTYAQCMINDRIAQLRAVR